MDVPEMTCSAREAARPQLAEANILSAVAQHSPPKLSKAHSDAIVGLDPVGLAGFRKPSGEWISRRQSQNGTIERLRAPMPKYRRTRQNLRCIPDTHTCGDAFGLVIDIQINEVTV